MSAFRKILTTVKNVFAFQDENAAPFSDFFIFVSIIFNAFNQYAYRK